MDKQKEILRWTSHPLVDNIKGTILVLVVMIIASLILYNTAVVVWQAPVFFFLGMLFFIGSLITWFIPTTYSLHEDKLVILYWKIKIERNWSDFGCWYADKKGVMLSTFKRPRRLDNFRGQSLRFSGDKSEKDELFNFLEKKIGNRY